MKNIVLEHYRFDIPIQIRMSDLDPFAHVNNGVQCHYCDIGRSAYLEHVLREKVDWITISLVLVHLELDFLHPIFYANNIVCESKIYEVGNRSLKMIQQLKDVNSLEVKTICKSTLCGFDRVTLAAAEIEEEQKRRVREFESL